MTDVAKIRDYAKNVNVDGRHEGDKVSAIVSFVTQRLQGVATPSGGQYQFVIEDDLALVAKVPDGFVPVDGKRYLATGILRNVGEFGLFPGMGIREVADA